MNPNQKTIFDNIARATGLATAAETIQVEQTPSYVQADLKNLLAKAPRSGHPLEICPSAARANRAIGLPGADR